MRNCDKLSLRQKIGQLIHIGGLISPADLKSVPAKKFGQTMTGGLSRTGETSDVLKAIQAGFIGGVYLGYPHFRDPGHARELISMLQDHASTPLFVAADFETGPGYNCASGCAHFPYPMGLAATDDEKLVCKAGEITGRQAMAMGVNWVYSPCLDVVLRTGAIIGIRAFAQTPEDVIRMGRAFLRGMMHSGVVSTAKHFPGCGNVTVDSHIALAYDEGTLEEWEHKSLPPFKMAIEMGVKSIMTSHDVYPFIDPGTPATYSEKLLTGILRDQLNYQGIIISDHLGMAGAHEANMGEACVRAFLAGCDILLAPFDAEIVPCFEKALQSGRISFERFEASFRRVWRAKQEVLTYASPEILVEDDVVAMEIGEKSVTVLKGAEQLPLGSQKLGFLIQWRNDESQYFPREPGVLAHLEHELRLQDPSAPVAAITRTCPPSEHKRVNEQLKDCQTVLFGTISKYCAEVAHSGGLTEGTVQLLNALKEDGKQLIFLILGPPYIKDQIQAVDVFICSYGDTLGNVSGFIKKLFTPTTQR